MPGESLVLLSALLNGQHEMTLGWLGKFVAKWPKMFLWPPSDNRPKLDGPRISYIDPW